MTRKTSLAFAVAAALAVGTLGFVGYLFYPGKKENDRKIVFPRAVTKQQGTPHDSRSVASAAGQPAGATEAAAVPRTAGGMVRIPGGSFMMGSPEGTGDPHEHPLHRVTVKGFYIDSAEVTQEEYARVMGTNPSHFKGCPRCPVDSVSWIEADEYCRRVGKRLPTEAQWEYAARAGAVSVYYWGNEMDGAYTWHYGNSDIQTHPVAQKKPNAFGIYDMIGNVWEWCADWYAEDYYRTTAPNDPAGPDSGKFRIARGGAFGYNREGYILRCAYRNAYAPEYRNINVGFRCAR